MARPVTTGVGIIALVFVPLLTLQGLEGKLFSPVALTIVYALAASLVLALTAIPVLASFLFRADMKSRSRLMGLLLPRYGRLLASTLARPWIVIGLSVALVAGAAASLPLLGRTFMPTLDEGDVIVQLEKLPSISLEASIDIDRRVQSALLARVPEVKGVIARSGTDELGLDPMGLNQTDSFAVLAPKSQWRRPDKAWLLDQMRAVFTDFPGVTTSFTQPIEMRVSEMLTGVRGDLVIKVFGPELDALNALTTQIAAEIRQIHGTEDVIALRNDGVQSMRVVVDRLGAARYGVSAERLQDALRMQIEGQPLGVVLESGWRTPLLLRGPPELRADSGAIGALRFTTDTGAAVPLEAFAQLRYSQGPVKIDREFGQRFMTVQANVRDRDLVGFVDEARARIAKEVALPAGFRIVWGGQFENQQRAAARLALVIPVVLALVVFVLWMSFGDLWLAALIVLLVPFALAGGIFSLLGFGEYLSVPASVGLIALLGIAVLNGVVMVETFEHQLAGGATVAQAALEGARDRLRPVLMTASITAFGLLPLLLATGPGSEVQRPLAVVVIGGLFSATIVTLFLLPVAWRWVANRRQAAVRAAAVQEARA